MTRDAIKERPAPLVAEPSHGRRRAGQALCPGLPPATPGLTSSFRVRTSHAARSACDAVRGCGGPCNDGSGAPAAARLGRG
jgi:hypothetical protein